MGSQGLISKKAEELLRIIVLRLWDNIPCWCQQCGESAETANVTLDCGKEVINAASYYHNSQMAAEVLCPLLGRELQCVPDDQGHDQTEKPA